MEQGKGEGKRRPWRGTEEAGIHGGGKGSIRDSEEGSLAMMDATLFITIVLVVFALLASVPVVDGRDDGIRQDRWDEGLGRSLHGMLLSSDLPDGEPIRAALLRGPGRDMEVGNVLDHVVPLSYGVQFTFTPTMGSDGEVPNDGQGTRTVFERMTGVIGDGPDHRWVSIHREEGYLSELVLIR